MRTRILLLAPFLLFHWGIIAQPLHSAKGLVYHDLNANGTRDAGEPGIANVAVSNGSKVVLTDAEGHYSIDIGDDDIIFVIKPGNFLYPVNEQRLPLFYYIHKPAGSPELQYKGVEPTGLLPSSIDFGLLGGEVADEFSAVVISDPQPYNLKEVGYYETAIAGHLRNVQDFSFGITLGDIVGDDLSLFEPLNRATASIGKTWFHVIGNHDMNFDGTVQAHADETYERVYGPSTYAFNHGKAHFIVLNNVIYPNNITRSGYVGGFSEEQFIFIENSLNHVPADHLVVLCMHIPLYNEHEYGETILAEHRDRLFSLLAGRPHTLSMSGHTHTLRHYYFGSAEGWMQEKPHHHYTTGTASGDWWSGRIRENGVPESVMYDGTPNGYSVLHIKGNSYSIDFVSVTTPEQKMRMYGPRVVPRKKHFRGQFYVNFFQGSERDTVYYSLNDGEWKRMRYTVEFDPYVCGVRYEWDNATGWPGGVRPSNPVLSYHLWKTRISTDLPEGANLFRVKVKDQFGREYIGDYPFEVVNTE